MSNRMAERWWRICRAVLVLSTMAAGIIPAGMPAYAQNSGDRVTIIVMDQSGSMNETDPLGLRCSAVRLMADLATEQDIYGLVRLESIEGNDRLAQVEIEPRRLGYQPDRDAFRAEVDCIAERYTPIADALLKAYELLEGVASARGGAPFRGQVLLLTDGAPAPDTEAQIAEIRALLPSFKAKGWTVDTVGLALRAQGLPGIRELLQEIVDQTGGTFLGDVADPADLQPLFVSFFARQTGRTSVPVREYALAAGGEEQIQIPTGTTRIDILVSKDQADATLTLVREDGQPISRNDSGVELLSTDDPYYNALSLVNPTMSRIYLRSDRPVRGLINLLTTTDLSLTIRQAAATRPANQPAIIEAFFARAGDANQPVALTGASVTGSAAIDGSGVPLQFSDDGSGGDAAAGDGIYTARVNLGDTLNEYAPRQVDVALEGVADGQRYYAQQVFDIVPVPSIELLDPDGVIDVPGGATITVPLRLTWRGSPISADGWSLEVIQIAGASRELLPVTRDGDRFVATIIGANALENAIKLSVTLRAGSGSASLQQPPIELPLTIRRAPGIQLYWDVADTLPLGTEVVFSAGLVLNGGLVSGVPLVATIERSGGTQAPVTLAPASTAGGVVEFRVTPDAVGEYIVRVSADGQALQPVQQTLRVAAEPQLANDEIRPCGSVAGTREQRRVRYRTFAQARNWPVVGGAFAWILDQGLFAIQEEQPFELCGTVQAGDAAYAGPWVVELRPAGDPDTVLQTVSGTGPDIRVTVLPGIAGDVSARFVIDDAFGPTIDCCETTTDLTLTEDEDSTAQWLIIGGIVLAFVLGAIAFVRNQGARAYMNNNPFESGDVLTVHGQGDRIDYDLTQSALPSTFNAYYTITLDLGNGNRTYRLVLDGRAATLTLNGVHLDASPQPIHQSQYEVSATLADRNYYVME